MSLAKEIIQMKEAISKAQLDKLVKAYANLSDRDIPLSGHAKLNTLLKSLDKKDLETIANSGTKVLADKAKDFLKEK